MIFLLLFEDLRCFNYLSNSVKQRTGIEISGIRQDIRPDIRYLAPTGYPTGYPVSGFQNGRISGKTAIRSIPSNFNKLSKFFTCLLQETVGLGNPLPRQDSSRREFSVRFKTFRPPTISAIGGTENMVQKYFWLS